MTIINILLIIFASFVLIKSADSVIISIRRLSRETHTQTFTVAAIILAIGTSLPELFVGITSALEGKPGLSLGGVTGSNIANLSLVAGLAAIRVKSIKVSGNYLKHDIWVAFTAGILPMILLFDGVLSRVDGLILLSTYLAYATGFFRKRYEQIAQEQKEETFIYRFLRQFNHLDAKKSKELGRFFVSIAVLIFSSDVIVRLSINLSNQLAIPSFLIGLFVIAIGTSLPELAFSFRSIKEHEPSMFFGNLLGSTIANSTLVLGLTAVISPVISVAKSDYMSAALFFIIIFLTLVYFVRSKHRLDRWEAALLIGLYLVFMLVEII